MNTSIPSAGSAGTKGLPFSRITLSITGTMASTREYEVLKTDTGVRASLYDGPWNYHKLTSREQCLQARVTGGPDKYAEMAAFFEEIGMRSWNKFHESDPNVLDGEMFSLDCVLTDGSTIRAHGSNAYPKNYHAFEDYLWNMLKG